MTQLASGPGRRYIQGVLNGLLVGDWTKGTTASVMAETRFPGKRRSLCPSSASQKAPNKQTLDLGRLLDFCSIACLTAHTEWVRNGRLVLCCLPIKLLFPSWASVRTAQLGLVWLSWRGLVHFWELYQDSSHLCCWGRTHLIPITKILLQNHFSVPLQALQAQPKGFPISRLQIHLPSSCVLLPFHCHTPELLRKDHF